MERMRRVAAKLDGGVINRVPDTFDDGFKSPCWLQQGKAARQCLPYFYLAGTFHAGAISLYAKLAVVPDVLTVGGAVGPDILTVGGAVGAFTSKS